MARKRAHKRLKRQTAARERPRRAKLGTTLYGPVGKAKMTRDWSLLVSDQDILDLVGASSTHSLYPLAARFVAIHDAIKKNDPRAIDKIAKESSAARFRTVVSAIRQGVVQGDAWSARYTARAVIAEVFRHTPAYFRALDAFIAGLRQG